MELENTPTPTPSIVLESLIVGLAAVLQQTPRIVTGEAPVLLIVPPEMVEVVVIELATFVVIIGNNVISTIFVKSFHLSAA